MHVLQVIFVVLSMLGVVGGVSVRLFGHNDGLAVSFVYCALATGAKLT